MFSVFKTLGHGEKSCFFSADQQSISAEFFLQHKNVNNHVFIFLKFLVQIVSIKGLFDNQNAIRICSFYSRLLFCKLYLLKWVKCAKNTFVSMSQTLFFWEIKWCPRFLDFYLFQDGQRERTELNVVQHFSSAFLRLIVKKQKQKKKKKNGLSFYVSCVPLLPLDPHSSRGRYLTIVSESRSLECKIKDASLTRKLVFPKSSVVSEMSRFYMDALRCQVA